MKFFKITYTSLLMFCLLSGDIKPGEKIVAKCGSINIYESEFKERFDFSAHPGLLKESDRNEAKHKFLQQLIAEKLLSLDAQSKGYDTLVVYKNFIDPLRNIFSRDALYKAEIKQKAVYTPDELSEGIERIKKIYKVKFIYSKNLEELQNTFSMIQKSASFDSLLSLRNESMDQKEPRMIKFGDMDKAVEDSLFKLKAGEFTGPLSSDDGYYLLKAVSVENNPDTRSTEMILDDVKRIVETRAEHKSYLNYYRNFFSTQKASADKDIFSKLALIFTNKLRIKYNDVPITKDGLSLRGYEISSLQDVFTDRMLNEKFVEVPGKPASLRYFINRLSSEGFFVKDLDDISIKASLSSYIRKFIEDELLTVEAESKKLHESPEVKKYMDMWKDSFLSKMVMMNFFDSLKVSEDEARELFKQEKGGNIPLESVNIAEVLTDSLETVELILNELSKGKNIKDLARQYTKRDSLKNRGGEFGLFPVTRYGDLGRIASQMEIDEVYGPLKLEEGYSVFQVLDKKTDTTYIKDFDVLKDQIVMSLTLEKFEKYVNEYNAKLADRYGVEIDENVLKGIDNVFLNLVVVRYMGFGGEIFAVPYTEQFDGWYKLWVENKNVNP